MKRYIGGLRWGSGVLDRRNFSRPFASLAISGEELLFTVAGREWRVGLADIAEVRVIRRICYKGLRFQHTEDRQAGDLLFWTFAAAEILRQLEGPAGMKPGAAGLTRA